MTLADVARRAGVSSTTVSFVLGGRDMGISPATADRVLEMARTLGYHQPAHHARARAPQMPVIAFVTDTVASDHYGAELIRGAVQVAGEHDYGIVSADTQDGRELEELVQELAGRGVEHFVYAALSTRVTRLPDALVDHVTVLVNGSDPRSIATAIVPDESSAGTMAARALVDAGHTDRIWLVGESGRGPYTGRERRKAVVAALATDGLVLDRQLTCAWWPPQARRAFAEAVTATSVADRPTAVLTMNDRVAMGVYQAADDLRMRVPRDLSVVSFDNSELSWWLSPALTGVGLPYLQMGRRAVEVLLGSPTTESLERVAMPLQRRDSVAPPRRRRP